MSGLLALQPLMAHAVDLSAAFSNLLPGGAVVTSNSPGMYQSGARTTFFAGGLSLAAPSGSPPPQLFSVTPPSISAGCGGISATFGGFSFISSQDFQNAIKSIASGAALGFVTMIVLKNLCPVCEAVVQFLKAAAQAASELAINSCQVGENLANSFLQGAGGTGATMPFCGSQISASGASSDFIQAMNSTCNSMKHAVDTLTGNAANKPEDLKKLMCTKGVGNVTWLQLSAFMRGNKNTAAEKYNQKIILMNLLGAQLYYDSSSDASTPGASCEQVGGGSSTPTPESQGGVFCAPTMSPKDVMGYFMCGDPSNLSDASQYPAVAQYCSQFFASAGTTLVGKQIYDCSAADQSLQQAGTDVCNRLVLTDASNIFTGQGFLYNVEDLLQKGVTAVRTNAPMPQDVIDLVQAAPVPLYQAINAAAVYPASAQQIIDSMSVLIAEQAAMSYFNKLLRIQGNSAGEGYCLTEAQAQRIQDAIGKFGAYNNSRMSLIAQNLNIQQGLSEQIRQINTAIQRNVLSDSMLGAAKTGQAMANVILGDSPQTQGGN